MKVKPLPRRIELIVFDFDGVLTDNRVWVMEDGKEAVICNRSDGLAFDLLKKVGIPTMILSTEQNPVVCARADKLRVPCESGCADKRKFLEAHIQKNDIPAESVVYVGNDTNDLGAIGIAGYSVAPNDAHPKVLSSVDWVLSRNGGQGVAQELVDRIFEAR